MRTNRATRHDFSQHDRQNSDRGIEVAQSSLTLHSSTVAENAREGIHIFNSSAMIYNSTIAFNSGGMQIYFYWGVTGNYGLYIYGSIVASTEHDACSLSQYNGESNITYDSAWNVYSDASCLSDVFVDHSIHNATIKLSELGDWGGPTPTMIPLPGSDAIDRAPASVCDLFGLDQRGLPRPVSSVEGEPPLCDIGAVELTTMPDEDLPSDGIFVDGFEDE